MKNWCNPKITQNELNVFIKIILIFILIILFTSIITVYNLDQMMDTTSKYFMLSVSETIEAKTVGYVKPIQALNKMVYDFSIVDSNFLNRTDALNLLGQSILNEFSQLQAFIIGNESGEFYMLKTEPDGYLYQRLISPALQSIEVTDRILRPDFSIVSEEKTNVIDYDPRVMPWYLGASSSNTNFWSVPYVFHSIQAPKLTISHAYYDEQQLSGVFGFDIDTYPLNQFLSELEFGKQGDIILIDENNKVIAYSHPEKIFTQSFAMKPIDVTSIDKPEILYTLEHAPVDNSVIIFKLNGNEYIGLMRSLKNSLDFNWKIVLVLSTNIFHEAYALTTSFTVAMNIMILILIALLFFYRMKELKSSAALYHFAHHDPLTNLYNRNYFNHHYNTNLDKSYALIICDIDHFKIVNDTYGHQVGDIILKEIAVLFKSLLRHNQVAFRWGGEEFLVLLENESLDEAVVLAEKLRETLENKTFRVDSIMLKITMSFGVSEHIQEHSFQEIVQKADQNLYKAKETGRNKVIY